MVTMSQAAKCPRCNNVGELVYKGRNKANPNYTDYQYECKTAVCPWVGTRWLVQEDDEGNIPERDRTVKSFPQLPELSPEGLKKLRTTFDDDISLHQPNQ